MTCKPSGFHRSDVEGPSGDFYDKLQASSYTQAVEFHRSNGVGERFHGPTG